MSLWLKPNKPKFARFALRPSRPRRRSVRIAGKANGGGKRDFGLDRDKIRVIETHFGVATDASKTNLVAFGVVTNESGHSWAIDQIEIRYLDRKGKLLGMDDQTEDFTILPKSGSSFQLDLDSYASAPGYAGCEVRVISAHDPRATFQLFGDD